MLMVSAKSSSALGPVADAEPLLAVTEWLFDTPDALTSISTS
jgi:hypothetical protein